MSLSLDGRVLRDGRFDARITLAVLRQLVEFEDHGSFGAVARHLGLSQPTVSSNMARLEQELGLPLFARSFRGTRLTLDGERVAAAARRVLDAADEFVLEVGRRGPDEPEPLRLAASLTIAEQLVPRWLARPGGTSSRASVSVGNSDEVMEWVLSDKVHLGFVEGNSVRRGLMWAEVGRDELVAVVGVGHPWARAGQEIVPTELVAGGLVVREHGSGTREVLFDALLRAGVAPPPELVSYGSTAAILTAVRHTGAVGVVSRLAADAALREGTLVRVAVAGLEMGRALRAVWNPATPQRRDAAELVGALSRQAAVAGARV